MVIVDEELQNIMKQELKLNQGETTMKKTEFVLLALLIVLSISLTYTTINLEYENDILLEENKDLIELVVHAASVTEYCASLDGKTFEQISADYILWYADSLVGYEE